MNLNHRTQKKVIGNRYSVIGFETDDYNSFLLRNHRILITDYRLPI